MSEEKTAKIWVLNSIKGDGSREERVYHSARLISKTGKHLASIFCREPVPLDWIKQVMEMQT